MYSWNKERQKENKRNKVHLNAKKRAGVKRRTIWGQTCEYMCMLSDRPATETSEERTVRILEKKIHRNNIFKR